MFFTAGEPSAAEEALKEVDTNTLTIPWLARYTLQYAEIAKNSERFYLARSLLGNSELAREIGAAPLDQQRRWHELRAELYGLIGEHLASADEYIKLAALYGSNPDIAAVHDKIWHQLGQVPGQQLRNASLFTTDDILEGWIQMALYSRDARGDIAQQLDLIAAWRRDHPEHPGSRIPPTSLTQAEAARGTLPRHLALLLPLSGELASAGEALREGFLAAYYQALASGSTVPAIRLYDTETGDISALYQQAVANGADLVVGPLNKDKLAALMEQPSLPVPLFGLNYADNTHNRHDNLYQFGLSISDETRQLAQQAWIDGHRSTLVIKPDIGWAESGAGAFDKQWHAQGGTIRKSLNYSLSSPDYSELLRDALLINDSQERITRLQRTLGKTVNSVPRRRGDIDMIMLFAYPEQGRQLKPTLDFLYAENLPVFATSHIYEGRHNPSQDQDLNGIRFTAMPWTIPSLAESGIRPYQPMAAAYRNLFAMGVDAYRLHQWLALLKALPDNTLRGQTGTLAMAAENRLVRTLPLAQFENGRVALAASALAEQQ